MLFHLCKALPLVVEPALRRQPVLTIPCDKYSASAESICPGLAASVSPFEADRAFRSMHFHDSLDGVHEQLDIRIPVAVKPQEI